MLAMAMSTEAVSLPKLLFDDVSLALLKSQQPLHCVQSQRCVHNKSGVVSLTTLVDCAY